jgi:DNA repair protein RadC
MNYKNMKKEELVFMLERSERYAIKQPEDIQSELSKYASSKKESFLVITLDGSNRLIKCHEISKGLINRCLVHPREVFQVALLDDAGGIIVAHNHPSGNLQPSQEDRDVTSRLIKAGEVMGIPVLDHIIIGNGLYSFLEHGELR